MIKQKHQRHGSGRAEAKVGQQRGSRQQTSSNVAMTPGRAPAEGGEEESPSHERWEQHTAERAPAEGPE